MSINFRALRPNWTHIYLQLGLEPIWGGLFPFRPMPLDKNSLFRSSELQTQVRRGLA
ncbi:hypothetical protein [Leptospira wolbachii]|uniref:hypothetical protein n=1 Tax=Leptospira wolbachii TaxID=29511 RepID=UPI0012EC0981|nr:hypothetical protein [Leptospira wolbachii]